MPSIRLKLSPRLAGVSSITLPQENVENFSGSRRDPALTSYSTAPPSYTGYQGGLGVANQRYSSVETTDNQVRAVSGNTN